MDGCFWHGCPLHHNYSKTNAGFWAKKVRVNRERDAETNALLMEQGWKVLRIWEHMTVDEAADLVCEEVHSARKAKIGSSPVGASSPRGPNLQGVKSGRR